MNSDIFTKLATLFNNTPPQLQTNYAEHEKRVVAAILFYTLDKASDQEIDDLDQNCAHKTQAEMLLFVLQFAYDQGYAKEIILKYKQEQK